LGQSFDFSLIETSELQKRKNCERFPMKTAGGSTWLLPMCLVPLCSVLVSDMDLQKLVIAEKSSSVAFDIPGELARESPQYKLCCF